MPVPFARQRFVVKSFNHAQAGRPGKRGDILPLFVSFQDFPGKRRELFVDTAVFFYSPHAILCLYYKWHVKADSASCGITLQVSGRRHAARDGNQAEKLLDLPQALSALLFLYREVLQVDLPWLDGVARAKRPRHVPVVLTENQLRWFVFPL
jgi:hypothetical protein